MFVVCHSSVNFNCLTVLINNPWSYVELIMHSLHCTSHNIRSVFWDRLYSIEISSVLEFSLCLVKMRGTSRYNSNLTNKSPKKPNQPMKLEYWKIELESFE